MAFYIVFILLLSALAQKNILNVTQNFTLIPETYAQVILTSVSQLQTRSKHFNAGTISISYNLSIINLLQPLTPSNENNFADLQNSNFAPVSAHFDLFLFPNPQNYYYLCYMSQITQAFPIIEECNKLLEVACQECPQQPSSEIQFQISQNLKSNFTQGPLQTNFQCYSGCTSLIISNLLIDMTEIANTAGVIVIDNTNFPLKGTEGSQELRLISSYTIEVISLETNYKYSWLFIGLFFLITLILGLVLCNICMSYRKIKQQQQQLSDGSTKTRSKEKIL